MTFNEIRKLNPTVRMGECEATAHEVGYNDERFEYLDQYIQAMINEGKILSGSYCLWKNGRVFVDAALGKLYCSYMENEKFRTDTFFSISSLENLILTIAIYKLMEDGLLYLEQPIKDLLSDDLDVEAQSISVRQLLGKESGKSAIKKIIRILSGMEETEYIKKIILQPCGMKDTHWRKEATADQLKRYNIANETDLELVEKKKAEISDSENEMMSTCRDMTRFGEMLARAGFYRGKRVIGRRTVLALLNNKMDERIKRILSGTADASVFAQASRNCVLFFDRKTEFAGMFQISFLGDEEDKDKTLTGITSILFSGLNG